MCHNVRRNPFITYLTGHFHVSHSEIDVILNALCPDETNQIDFTRFRWAHVNRHHPVYTLNDTHLCN